MKPLIKISADDACLNGPQLFTTVPVLGEEIAITYRDEVVTLQVNDQIYDVATIADRRGKKRQQAVITLVCTTVRRLQLSKRAVLRAS